MSDDTSSALSSEQNKILKSDNLYVVGVGASAGGLDAIERLFGNMPIDSNMAFVVVQHLSPDFESLMDELLARHTSMPIHRVKDGMQVEANGIYLIPPKKNMMLSQGKLLLTDQDSAGSLNLPIDIFFRSLAQDVGNRAIAIVLSGTGSDGSRGLRDVHDAGGLVLVQDLESASFDGMPRSAASTEVVDVVCPPELMPQRIQEYLRNPVEFDREQIHYPDDLTGTGDRYEIFRLFRHKFGIDFSLYKPATIDRRIERRVQLTRSNDLKSYVESLESNTEELDTLYRDLLVEVTQFFRDPESFDIVRTEVIPRMVADAEPDNELRAWVPGCATGEEAYSLAMLFQDEIARTDKDISFKVFATDVHQNSLEMASSGVYTRAALENVPEDFQSKYFTASGDLYHITRELRQRVIFAPNDITRDPPFTKIDFISCRNVLIYLEPKVQKKVLSLFHFGLETGGILFLGPSESLGDLANDFATIDRHWRIYRKERDARLPMSARLPMTSALSRVISQRPPFVAKSPLQGTDPILANAFHELLTKYVPPSLLVNEYFELVHSFGDATKLLIQPEGRSTLDVLKMVNGDLRMAMSAALHKASQQRSPVVYKGVRVNLDDEELQYKVVVEPFFKDNHRMYLISMDRIEVPVAPEPSEEQFDVQEQSTERISVLEQELSYTRESLQSTVEELETSNEELQSTNEELIASNEELQSTNEELHSVNEELYTVNAEHKQKIEELTQLTNDMDNLLKSTHIGTVFLDRSLHIRMFTPAISAAFNMLDQDIGRPIDHIAFRLDHPNLMGDVSDVMQHAKPIERECKGADQKTYLFRVMPYRTGANRMDGIAMTVTDITAVKEVEKAQQRNVDLAQANKDLQDFAYAVSHDLQAPLRHLGDACQELKRTMSPVELESYEQMISQIGNSSASLSRMIQGLLTYSRVSTRGKTFGPVDCEEILVDAVEELSEQITDTRAEVTSDDLPTIRADDRQITRVFLELLDNAVLYRGKTEPKIHIGCRKDETDWLFSFEDNGVGIEERHYERIFIIFQRLGFKPEVRGNGLGLALTKRIVERHGGRIWVESVPEEKTTFYFTIPAI